MSGFNILHSSVSGMAAQATRLGAVSENIANVATTGYKNVDTQFSSLVEQIGTNAYLSGGVVANLRYATNVQGGLVATSSPTDLAIQGRGFFVVSDTAGRPLLTRAGAFQPDAQGVLRNAAGYALMGSPVTGTTPTVANSLAGLTPVTIDRAGLVANPTSSARLVTNLPPDSPIVAAANLPSANAPSAAFTAKSSIIVYDNVGREVMLDIYQTRTGPNAWETAVFNRADAGPGGGFPYAAPALATTSLSFDPSTGRLAAASPTSLAITVPGGSAMALDLAGTSELAGSYEVLGLTVNGNAPSRFDHVEVDGGGLVTSVYANGTRIVTHQLPLVDVPNPQGLTVIPGNAFAVSERSGVPIVAAADTSGLGKVVSGALEASTVDLGEELTAMIEAQRAYSANSKVFQAGADMLDVLINLRT